MIYRVWSTVGREKGTLSSIRLKLELKNSVVLKKIGFFFNLHSDDFREDTEASVLKKKIEQKEKISFIGHVIYSCQPSWHLQTADKK